MGVTNALKKIPKVGDGMVDALHKTKSSIKQLVIPGMLFENMGLTYLGYRWMGTICDNWEKCCRKQNGSRVRY